MDNMQFGAFVAQLRKEQHMTQRDLAERLHVTDKAVSKWETGKGFPDVKLLEPLADALGVSLVELIQGKRQGTGNLTVAEADTVISQALDQSQRINTRRYLGLFRWLLVGISAVFTIVFILPFLQIAAHQIYFDLVLSKQYGVIGGADGLTFIITSSSTIPLWVYPLAAAVIVLICLILAVRVWKLERKLK